MYSAYKLNMQSNNIQPWRNPFPICNLSTSSSNCCFMTCIQVSQEAGQVVWYSHLFNSFPQSVVIHTVKGFSVGNEAEVDVFLEFSSFCMLSLHLSFYLSFCPAHTSSLNLPGLWTLSQSQQDSYAPVRLCLLDSEHQSDRMRHLTCFPSPGNHHLALTLVQHQNTVVSYILCRYVFTVERLLQY